jgi:hypothetical protein
MIVDYEVSVVILVRLRREGRRTEVTDLEEAIAQLLAHRAWAERERRLAAGDEDAEFIARLDRTIALAERIYREEVMDAAHGEGAKRH